MVSNGVVIKAGGKITLTQVGVEIFEELSGDGVYFEEKTSLAKAKKHLSEAAVKRLFEGV